MNEQQRALIDAATKIIIVQAENIDGDSLGTSLGLESILGAQGKDVTMHSTVDVPKYLRYYSGWDRVSSDFDTHADMAIIVDTSSETLLSKTLQIPGVRHFFETHPVIVLDHHGSAESTLPFEHEFIMMADAVATGEMVARIAINQAWTIDKDAAVVLYGAIMSDSLGLTTQNTTSTTVRTIADLVDHGAVPAEIEAARRLLMKKSPEILAYKAKLIDRIEYHLEGTLATVHIPWADIETYSDQYNPSMLVLDEMRLVEGVEVTVAIKTYPDGKATGKLRTNVPVADKIAGYFGGGGHAYAAGFRIYESYDETLRELLVACDSAMRDYRATL